LRAALAAARLQNADSAWALLRAQNAPVIIAILGEHLAGDTKQLPAPQLFEAVDAELPDLRSQGFDLPQTGMMYCRDWLAAGFLVRRPGEQREEIFELSQGALAAIRFVQQLIEPRSSVTESRLTSIVNGIRQLAVETDPNTANRIAALQAQREKIDQQIAALHAGHVEALPSDRAVERVRDILLRTAELPEDFARVRSTLEQLNQEVRRQLVEEPTSRGAVLDDVFRGVDLLAESDAGRSFTAFHALVLDPERTVAFEDDIAALIHRPFASKLTIDEVKALTRLLPTIQDSSSEIHQVMTSFGRSLRRFVQSEELAEDRRVHRLVRETMVQAHDLTRQVNPARKVGFDLALTGVSLTQLAGMRLHNPADAETTTDLVTDFGSPEDIEELRAFVRASEIDMRELVNNVAQAITEFGPVTIAEVLAHYPATQGVASVVGLVVLAADHARRTGGRENVHWTLVDQPERYRQAEIPQFLFTELAA